MYKIITMEREFASGGNEIGRKVAKRADIGTGLKCQHPLKDNTAAFW